MIAGLRQPLEEIWILVNLPPSAAQSVVKLLIDFFSIGALDTGLQLLGRCGQMLNVRSDRLHRLPAHRLNHFTAEHFAVVVHHRTGGLE
jgi:hypothetical protein